MVGRLLINMAALGLDTWLVPGIELAHGSLADSVIALALVAVVFGVVNTVVKPLFTLLSSPLILLTLGLMLLVVNAALLGLTSWLAGVFSLGWFVDGFWASLFGAIVVSVVSFILIVFVGKK